MCICRKDVMESTSRVVLDSSLICNGVLLGTLSEKFK